MLVLYHFFEVYFEFQYMGLFRLSEKIGTLNQRSGRMQEMRVQRRTALRDERLLRPGGCPPELASISAFLLRPPRLHRSSPCYPIPTSGQALLAGGGHSMLPRQKNRSNDSPLLRFFQLVNKYLCRLTRNGPLRLRLVSLLAKPRQLSFVLGACHHM